MLIQTAEYNAKLLSIFIKWYTIEIPLKIVDQLYKYIIALTKIYSFVFLLKTLFSPWKNQVYAYPQKGFDLSLIFQVWTYNMIARIVGAIIRLATIFIGVFIIILTIFFGISILILWLLYPVLFIVLIMVSL
jgi:hypothetical protein